MAGSSFGKIFTISTWGESHGPALGVTIDGCPAGVPLSEDDIALYLDRRKPGRNAASTPRREDDKPEILSGVFEGRTTGAPIQIMVRNTSQRSGDYDEIKDIYRPGHADYTFDAKYGFRDYRGGGRSSGRETIGRVAAGAVAAKVLAELGIKVEAYTVSIGDIQADVSRYDYENVSQNGKSSVSRDEFSKRRRETSLKTPTGMPDEEADKRAMEYIEKLKSEMNSTGGCMECRINGVPAGVGDPVFEKLDAMLAGAVMSIGAVKAVEIGDGIEVSSRTGSGNNDAFRIENGNIVKKTNHSGGILGGISDGSEIIIRAHVKPTPSIAMTQETVTKDGKETDVNIKGRHDPVIVPRAVVVMESMCAITVLDALLKGSSAKLDNLLKLYKS